MRLMEKPKTLAEMRPDLTWPPGLQAVFDKVLARDMTERYAVAADFGAELVRAAQAAGVAVPRQSPYGAVTTAMDAMAVGKAGTASTVPATRVAAAVEPPTLPRGPGGAEGPSAPPPWAGRPPGFARCCNRPATDCRGADRSSATGPCRGRCAGRWIFGRCAAWRQVAPGSAWVTCAATLLLSSM